MNATKNETPCMIDEIFDEIGSVIWHKAPLGSNNSLDATHPWVFTTDESRAVQTCRISMTRASINSGFYFVEENAITRNRALPAVDTKLFCYPLIDVSPYEPSSGS